MAGQPDTFVQHFAVAAQGAHLGAAHPDHSGGGRPLPSPPRDRAYRVGAGARSRGRAGRAHGLAGGVRIALDDFGTGYSSLYHLRNFKIDKLKIDRSFVANMERGPEGDAFIRALLGLGHGLGMTVTAEGVEQLTQAATLLEHGCEQAQGFLYSRAMPAAEAIRFMTAYGGSTAEARAH